MISEGLQAGFRKELAAIANWWIANTPDYDKGGFIGEITVENEPRPLANKGIILNSRILWFFSEAANFLDDSNCREAATRAWQYIQKNFVDEEYGGVFWELSADGSVVNTRKQIYAQAFAIYGLSRYYGLTQDIEALELAVSLFELIEAKAHDGVNKGYIEAFAGDWGPLDDFRLSEKDLNSPKSMNTHLHILEAYTALYDVTKNIEVEAAIKRCIDYFDTFIINKDSYHLRMFQSMEWEDLSTSISYGHDIECSWLLWEALEVIGDKNLLQSHRETVVRLAETCLQEAVGPHHEVLDAYNFKTATLCEERVWWVQAEALVGFLNAWHMTSEQKYFNAAKKVWEFIQQYQIDSENGEWHWLSVLDKPHVGDCKVGFWKAPYHNGRAMMEAYKLLAKTKQ